MIGEALRDRVAISVANWVLRHVARPETVRTLDYLIWRGMRAVDEDYARAHAHLN